MDFAYFFFSFFFLSPGLKLTDSSSQIFRILKNAPHNGTIRFVAHKKIHSFSLATDGDGDDLDFMVVATSNNS